MPQTRSFTVPGGGEEGSVGRVIGSIILPSGSDRGFSGGERGRLRSWQLALFPEDVDGRVDEELQRKRGHEAADHRRRDALHQVGVSTAAPPTKNKRARKNKKPPARPVVPFGRTRLTAP